MTLDSADLAHAMRRKADPRSCAATILLVVAALIVAVGIVLLFAGCGGRLGAAVTAINAASVTLSAERESLAASHRRARDLAVEHAGSEPEARVDVSAVHARYRPAWDAYEVARSAYMQAYLAAQEAVTSAETGKPETPGRLEGSLVALSVALAAFEVSARALGASTTQAVLAPSAGPEPAPAPRGAP